MVRGPPQGRGGSLLRNQNPRFQAGKDPWLRCQEPVTRVAPRRPKRQGGDRQPRRGDRGLGGEWADGRHPSQVPLGPLTGVGEPETPGKEMDCRDVLVSGADVGSSPPCSFLSQDASPSSSHRPRAQELFKSPSPAIFRSHPYFSVLLTSPHALLRPDSC